MNTTIDDTRLNRLRELGITSTDEELLWLAREMDDHTCGNSVILLDWGNAEIQCLAGIAPCNELKNRLRDMAIDYMRLKKKEMAEKACQA